MNRLAWLACFLLTAATLQAQETRLYPCTLDAPTTRPGYGVKALLHWESQPLAEKVGVFVHVRDARGNIVVQVDHEPPVPTTEWKGKVEYPIAIALPADMAPGEYALVVGLWDGKQQQRRPVDAAGGALLREPDGVLAGTFRVEPGAPLPKLAAPTLDLKGYRVTFDEDFTGPLNVSAWGPGTRWIAHTPFNLDFGDAQFTDPQPGFPFTVGQGLGRITARKEADGRWRGGLLASVDTRGRGFAQQYGYFEMRAQLPPGEGTWPGFWLMGTPRLQPGWEKEAHIEIDVVEQYGARPNCLHATVHWWGPEKAHRGDERAFIVPGMTEGMHRYGVMITPEWLTFYYDGVELRRMPTPAEAKVPLFLMANLALGSGWPTEKTPNPSELVIDYLRVWAKE